MSKEKHLEFIQGVINRHNSNSFTLKGWAVTIAAALFALAGTVHEPLIVLTSLLPTLLFWGLDAFYLANERCFVDLYSAVAKGSYELRADEMWKKGFEKAKADAAAKKVAEEQADAGNAAPHTATITAGTKGAPKPADIETLTGSIPDFEMNFKRFEKKKKNSWVMVLGSKSIFWFYFLLVVLTIGVMCLFMSNASKQTPIDVNATLKTNSIEIKLNERPAVVPRRDTPAAQKDTTKR